MPQLRHILALAFIASTSVGCDKLVDLLKSDSSKHASSDDDDDDDDEDDKAERKKKKKKSTSDKKSSSKKKSKKGGYLADTGFRPAKDGYNFENTGGKYPMSPPVVTDNVVVKLFGAGACVGGDIESCRLTEPAAEWANMVNHAMNGGQCEGMAVSSLTFFKNIDKPKSFTGKGAHDVDRAEATPLIGYYWAYQTLNPVKRESLMGRIDGTPNKVEDKLIEMFQKNQLATLAFWGPPGHGGHAVTPYAVEDRGNGVHWIRIYDNNYPGVERYITIDRNANSWSYDLASINPDVPKMPWGGNAESHNIVAIPLDLRLQKAECPFCRGNTQKKTVWPWAASVSIHDQDGHRVAFEDGKLINEIPNAEVIDISGFTPDGPPVEPIFVLPAENDYEISLGSDKGSGGSDDHRGVTVFGNGTAMSVEGLDLKSDEKDTLSVAHDSDGVRYKPGTGRMPSLRLAVDDEKTGLSVRVANMKTDANSEVELKLDRKAGKLTVQGGSKASSYDIKLKHVARGSADQEVEQKDIKLKLGESHNIDTTPPPPLKPGAKLPPIRISRGTFVLPKVSAPQTGPRTGPDPKTDPKTPVVAPKINPITMPKPPVGPITKPVTPQKQ